MIERRIMREKPQQIGPYVIKETLGQGGMGIVYQAQHQSTNEVVALKTVLVTHEKMLRSIRREIRILAGIKHPGIVRIMDQGEHHGLPWYAMELLEGVTLRYYISRLRSRGRISSDTLTIGRENGQETGIHEERTSCGWWTKSLTVQDIHETTDVPFSPERESEAGAAPIAPAHDMPGDLLVELPPLLTLIRRLCTPLAFLHGAGIVHRD